jgi:hypothetical protein
MIYILGTFLPMAVVMTVYIFSGEYEKSQNQKE